MSDTLEIERIGNGATSGVNQHGQRLGAKGLRTRKRLIDVTTALLETHGLRDLTVAEVARTAETSPATFYVYFEGVPEVVLAALETVDHSNPQLLDLLKRDWSGPDGLSIARQFVDSYCKVWDVNRTVFRVRNMAAEEGDARFLKARHKAARPILSALAESVDRAQKIGRVSKELHALSTAAAIMTLLERLAAVGPTTRSEQDLSFEAMIDSSACMIGHVLGVA
jgi:AcrR family transcriptional regulator